MTFSETTNLILSYNLALNSSAALTCAGSRFPSAGFASNASLSLLSLAERPLFDLENIDGFALLRIAPVVDFEVRRALSNSDCCFLRGERIE